MVVVLVLARLLGAEEFGAYTYALAWALLLTVPATLGLTPLIVRNVAAYREHRNWGLLRGLLRRSNEAVALSSAVCVGVGAVVALVLNHDDPQLLRPLLLALALVPIIAFTSIRQSAMQGLDHIILGRVPETLLGPCLFLLALGGALLAEPGFGVVGRRCRDAGCRPDRRARCGRIPAATQAPLRRPHSPLGVQDISLGAKRGAAAPLQLHPGHQRAGRGAPARGHQGSNRRRPVQRRGARDRPDRLHTDRGKLSNRADDRQASRDWGETKPCAGSSVGQPLRSLWRPYPWRHSWSCSPTSCSASSALCGSEGGETALIILVAGQLVFRGHGIAGTVLVMTGHESLLAQRRVGHGDRQRCSQRSSSFHRSVSKALPSAQRWRRIAAGRACFVYYARRRARVPSSALGL